MATYVERGGKYIKSRGIEGLLKQVEKHFPDKPFITAELAEKTGNPIMSCAYHLGNLCNDKKIKKLGDTYITDKEGRKQLVTLWQLAKK